MNRETVSSAWYTLDLCVDFYPRPAIEQALAAFEAVAQIRVDWGERYQHVTMQSRAGVSTEEIAREFANHVLAAVAVGGLAPTASGREGSGAKSGPR